MCKHETIDTVIDRMLWWIMTDFKLDTDALISKAHETEALLLKPTDDFAQYAHRLKGIDVEGMFNMYEMESDYWGRKLVFIIERFIRNGFHKKNAIIAYVLIDMLMNGINEHIHERNDLTG